MAVLRLMDKAKQQRLSATVLRAAEPLAEQKPAVKVGLLRLKPYPRIEFENDGETS